MRFEFLIAVKIMIVFFWIMRSVIFWCS